MNYRKPKDSQQHIWPDKEEIRVQINHFQYQAHNSIIIMMPKPTTSNMSMSGLINYFKLILKMQISKLLVLLKNTILGSKNDQKCSFINLQFSSFTEEVFCEVGSYSPSANLVAGGNDI